MVHDEDVIMSHTSFATMESKSKSSGDMDSSDSTISELDKNIIQSETHIRQLRSELILKEKTPWMQDLELQVERVLAILEKAIIKLRILIMIPKLLENNNELLQTFFSKEQAHFISSICSNYLTEDKKTTSASERMFIPYLKEKKEKLDPQMTNVMNILYRSEALVDAAKKYSDHTNDQTNNLVYYLEKLKDTVKIKLNVTAEEEQLREQELHRAFHANELCRAEIEKLETQLEQQREELGNMLKVKEDLIASYQEKLNAIEENFKHSIIKRVNESEKQMVKESIASEARRTDLAVEAKNATIKYEQMLEANLAEEKAMRAKRTKIETQLATWLAKFDSEIGERNTEFEKVQAEYDEEKASFDALQEKMDEQDIEYHVLMREKDMEERRLFEIKALEFLKNRSARRIQRAWKAYKERKEMRKKRRKAAKARAEKKVQEKLAASVAKMKKKKEKKEEPAKAEPSAEEVAVEESVPETKADETLGEFAEEEELKKKKKGKEKGKGKGKGKKGKKMPKGEIPKSKKDIHVTKEDDANAMLETAFGGQFEEIDTTATFNKEEVKVDLAEL